MMCSHLVCLVSNQFSPCIPLKTTAVREILPVSTVIFPNEDRCFTSWGTPTRPITFTPSDKNKS